MHPTVRRYFILTVAATLGVALVQALALLALAHLYPDRFRSGPSAEILGALMVPMLVLGVSGAFLILRLTSRQLGKVDRVLRMMSAGDLSARLSLPVDPDTAGVVLSFNRMAEKVETTIEKLRRSDESRRQLLADVTHELNTPLTSVLGYLETLTMEDLPLSPERRVALTQIAYEEAVNLRALIEDLTTLSRLDAEGLPIERVRVGLGQIVERVARRLSQIAEQRGVPLKTQIDPDVAVRGDAQRLDQVVRNLAENALRHTSPPGDVTVVVRRSGQSAIVEVIDKGAGIPPEALGKLGQRFLRLDKSRARHTGGRGLGLAITVGLVEMHGGRVDFESELGSGTRVRVTLPLLDEEQEPAVPGVIVREPSGAFRIMPRATRKKSEPRLAPAPAPRMIEAAIEQPDEPPAAPAATGRPATDKPAARSPATTEATGAKSRGSSRKRR